MFVLYRKVLHIVKEPQRKNCTCQTYRAQQIAMCESREPLERIINNQTERERTKYYIEERQWQK